MSALNLTTLETRILDALAGTSICSSDFEWIDDTHRRFSNCSDASRWAIENGLTSYGTDDAIITTIFALIEKGRVKRTDSRRKSSEWFSLTDEGVSQL